MLAAVPDERSLVGDRWERLALTDTVASAVTPAYHWANRWPSDVRMALVRALADNTDRSIWFAGDTSYGDGAIFPTSASVSALPMSR